MQVTSRPTLAVFASDKGPGDAERASIMSQAGMYFARRGARILCLAESNMLPVPLVTAARAAGAEVLLIADDGLELPPALSGLPVEVVATPEERTKRVASLADAFVGLPGSLASASSLYATWIAAGGGMSGKPVVLYNRNHAFEVLRGFAGDVLSHSLKGHDKKLVFADSIEDVWNKLSRLLNVQG